MHYHHKKKKTRVTKNVLIIILILFLCSSLCYLVSSTIGILKVVRTKTQTVIPQVIIEPPKPHLYLDIQCTGDEIPCGNKCIKHDIDTFCKS